MSYRNFPMLALVFVFLATGCSAERFWWEKMKSTKLTINNYKSFLGKDRYVFVEFYSKGCQYCEKLYPQLNKLVDEIENGTFPRKDIVIARIDGEEFTELTEELEIDAFPTMYLYKPNDAEYPEKYDYNHKIQAIKGYLSTHPIAPKYAKGSLRSYQTEYRPMI